MTDFKFLQEVDIFKGLNQDQLASIAALCKEKTFKNGEMFFKEDESAEYLWVMADGKVDLSFNLPGRVSSEATVIATVPKARVFGWSSLLPPYQYRLNAVCSSDVCRVLCWDREALKGLFDQDKTLGYRVTSNLAAVISDRVSLLKKSGRPIPYAKTKVTVHLATCGIAAGGREIMTVLVDELAAANRTDIQVTTGGCLGRCETEPNVTVEVEGTDPVIYQKMTPDKVRLVCRKHLLHGKAVSEFMLV